MSLVLSGGRLVGPEAVETRVVIADGRVVPEAAAAHDARHVDLEGRWLLPGLVNAHDDLDLSTCPRSGTPPYANLYDWIAETSRNPPPAALAAPLRPDRLFLGGLRNLLAGVTAVAHHGPDHRSLHREDYPVRVLARYSFAHSPGLTPALRRTYRTTDRRVPWLVRAAAGTDERAAFELELLAAAHVIRKNTVIVHGTGLRAGEAARLAEAGACVVWCPEADAWLFGAQPPVPALLAAGVRIGLGSGSPASGARDALSNLAAARATGLVPEDELLGLATTRSAEVARLPVGGIEPGKPADLIAVDSLEDLQKGRRSAIALVLVAGRPAWGEPRLLGGQGPSHTLVVDGRERAIRGDLGRRAAAIVRRCPVLGALPWLAEVRL